VIVRMRLSDPVLPVGDMIRQAPVLVSRVKEMLVHLSFHSAYGSDWTGLVGGLPSVVVGTKAEEQSQARC
jgi:hypothetical protein